MSAPVLPKKGTARGGYLDTEPPATLMNPV